MGPLRNANATRLLASPAISGSNVIFRFGIGISQTRNHTQTSGRDANRRCSQTCELGSREQAEIENDFQKECRKGAEFAAHTAFSAILGEISCLFSLALEFFTRLRGGRCRVYWCKRIFA